MIRKLTLTLTLASVLAGTYIQKGYGASFEELLTGTQVPLNVQLKTLDKSWRKMAISGQTESGDYLRAYYNLVVKSAINFFGSEGNINVYYTQGKTVKIGSETYLVAYHLPIKPIGVNVPGIMQKQFACAIAKSEPIKPETLLTLSFLNLRTIGSLNNVNTFDLNEELAASKQAAEKAQSFCNQPESTSPESAGLPSESTEPVKEVATDSGEIRLGGLYAALMGYTEDHDGILPNMTDIETVKEELQDRVPNEMFFNQPKTDEPYQPNTSLSEKKFAEISNREQIVAFYEAKAAQDGTVEAVFLVRTVKRVSADEWLNVKRRSGLP